MTLALGPCGRGVIGRGDPEVSGAAGLRSLALTDGFPEADRPGRLVATDDLLSGTVAPYQDDLAAGLPDRVRHITRAIPS